MRNPNIGIAVSATMMLVGCWLAGWDVDENEAFWIVFVPFFSGLALLMWLDDRFPSDPRSRARHRR
jgi:UDP-N-acetylmuramyl pentapeptide phosphotransferase/UDP-N-acetylglucosamine-1-phosphate transferase